MPRRCGVRSVGCRWRSVVTGRRTEQGFHARLPGVHPYLTDGQANAGWGARRMSIWSARQQRLESTGRGGAGPAVPIPMAGSAHPNRGCLSTTLCGHYVSIVPVARRRSLRPRLRRPWWTGLAAIIGLDDPHVRAHPEEGTKRRAEPVNPLILECENREGGSKGASWVH